MTTPLVIGLKRHGETSVIAELMTRGHGRHLGLVRGGRSRIMRPVLQPGNSVTVHWRARIEDHLGTFTIEALEMRAATLMGRAATLHGINHLTHLLRLLPEREPHPFLLEAAELVLLHLDEPEIGPALTIRLELALLAALGFGLDLACCAATGGADDLAYVSPRTGRAVSRAAGAPFHDRLLRLPPFLRAGWTGARAEPDDIVDGFRLTAHFLARDVLMPRGLTAAAARDSYLVALRSGA